MNFDRLAPHYPWLEKVFAGELMQRCRTTFLGRVRHCRRALLVGEGTGKFLVALLQQNPDVKVTCIEHSGKMLAQIKRRLKRFPQGNRAVNFVQADALNWHPPAAQFDLIVTNFFLDCFPAGALRRLVASLAHSATADAVWLLADFRLPESGWRRWRAQGLLAGLYWFFRWFTALPAKRLTAPEPFLAEAGFFLAARRLASFGFAYSDCWQRTKS